MVLRNWYFELTHILMSLFSKRTSVMDSKAALKEVEKVIEANPEVKVYIEKAKEEVAEVVGENITSVDPKPLTQKERVRRILDLIMYDVAAQKYMAPEIKELNIIHPGHQLYIATLGASYASEKTEGQLQNLLNKKGYLYAEWYCYEALSAQWRKVYANLIIKSGKKVANNVKGFKFLAEIHELWRQTVWADKKYADQWLIYNRISDAELREFLLVLAADEVQFLPKMDYY